MNTPQGGIFLERTSYSICHLLLLADEEGGRSRRFQLPARPNCRNAESGEPTPAVSFEGCFTPSLLCQVWEGRWRVIPHDVLPDWLKDNDFLLHGHRPPMPSFRACFKSIFRIHTETGNIWTHLLGNAQTRSPNTPR